MGEGHTWKVSPLHTQAAAPRVCLCAHEASAFTTWRAENGKLVAVSLLLICSPLDVPDFHLELRRQGWCFGHEVVVVEVGRQVFQPRSFTRGSPLYPFHFCIGFVSPITSVVNSFNHSLQ